MGAFFFFKILIYYVIIQGLLAIVIKSRSPQPFFFLIVHFVWFIYYETIVRKLLKTNPPTQPAVALCRATGRTVKWNGKKQLIVSLLFFFLFLVKWSVIFIILYIWMYNIKVVLLIIILSLLLGLYIYRYYVLIYKNSTSSLLCGIQQLMIADELVDLSSGWNHFSIYIHIDDYISKWSSSQQMMMMAA